MIDPILQTEQQLAGTALARSSINRRDLWPSRREAANKFRSSKFYQQWDPRVLDKWIEFGVREIPNEQYPEPSEAGETPVTLTTPVNQEMFQYVRPFYKEARLLQEDDDIFRDVHPDDKTDAPFGKPEMPYLYRRLPEVRPSVLFIFGKTSPTSQEESRCDKMKITGTGVGGSGGAARGRVHEKLLDAGHLVPLEKPAECAEASIEFIVSEIDRWNAEEQRRYERWLSLSRKERVEINDLYRQKLSSWKPPGPSDGIKSKNKL